jgi:hypothetical protein
MYEVNNTQSVCYMVQINPGLGDFFLSDSKKSAKKCVKKSQ